MKHHAQQPAEALSKNRWTELLATLALILGVLLWLFLGNGNPRSLILAAVAALVAGVTFVPTIKSRVSIAIDFLATPSPRAASLLAIASAAATGIYLLFDALHLGRVIVPQWHDEFGYIIQSQMLARGRLWMHPHPMGDYFASIYLFVKPVYSAIYFPGTALLNVPARWLELPYWSMPLLFTSATAAIIYLVLLRLTDGIAALLAAPLVVGVDLIQSVSLRMMSQTTMLFVGALMGLLFLRWHERQSRGRAIALGAAAGLAAITRPLDAVAFAVPIGIAVLWALRHRPRKEAIAQIAWMVVAASPLLAIQLIFNFGVTGSPFTSPHQWYVHEYMPAIKPGFDGAAAAAASKALLPQVREIYRTFIDLGVNAHSASLVDTVFSTIIPNVFRATLAPDILLVLLPAGVLAAWKKQRWVIVLPLLTFVGGYLLMPVYVAHYGTVLLAPAIILAMLGKSYFEEVSAAARVPVTVGISVWILLAAIAGLPEFAGAGPAGSFRAVEFESFDFALTTIKEPSALVFVRYETGDNPEAEPVFNFENAWPDDARIVRAHDLGARNMELLRYYNGVGQDRAVYLYVRRTNTLTYIGTVRQLTAAGV